MKLLNPCLFYERGIDGTSISKLTYVPKDVERGQPIKPSNHFEVEQFKSDPTKGCQNCILCKLHTYILHLELDHSSGVL